MGDSEATTRKGRGRALRFSVINSVIISIVIILAIGLLFVARATNRASENLQNVIDVYISGENAAVEMRDASNYLTTQARMFVLTGEPSYLRRYLIEERDTQRRENAVASLQESTNDESALQFLSGAMTQSEVLAEREHYALKLVVVADDIPEERGARELSEVELSAEDAALPDDEKKARAKELVFDEDYQKSREYIDRMIDQCEESLVLGAHEARDASRGKLDTYLLMLSLFAVLLLGVVVAATITHITLILRPLRSYTERVNNNEPLETIGAAELQLLARAYNNMYEENEAHKAHLVHEAEHDPLTGLLNRSAYNRIYDGGGDMALLIADIDYFKKTNDDYGHDVGDEVLCAVANVLKRVFRTTDYPCRIGGDEFAVIMPAMRPEFRDVVEKRLANIREELDKASGELPPLTLSIGIAFSSDADETTTLYKAADLALYSVKSAGRNGHAFYSDLQSE